MEEKPGIIFTSSDGRYFSVGSEQGLFDMEIRYNQIVWEGKECIVSSVKPVKEKGYEAIELKIVPNTTTITRGDSAVKIHSNIVSENSNNCD